MELNKIYFINTTEPFLIPSFSHPTISHTFKLAHSYHLHYLHSLFLLVPHLGLLVGGAVGGVQLEAVLYLDPHI